MRINADCFIKYYIRFDRQDIKVVWTAVWKGRPGQTVYPRASSEATSCGYEMRFRDLGFHFADIATLYELLRTDETGGRNTPARFAPAAAPTARPVGVPPVKSIFLTYGCWHNSFPTSVPKPGKIFNILFGNPASVHMRPNSITDTGANSDGFTITEFPVAIAGAIFFIAISIG